MISPDSPRRHDHRASCHFEITDHSGRALHAAIRITGLEHGSARAGDGAVGDYELVNPVAKSKGDVTAACCVAYPLYERLEDSWPRSPCDVKSRNGVARSRRTMAAALGPADHREESNATLMQPQSLLACSEADVRLRPFSRPVIFLSIEAGGSKPVLPREIEGIANAHSPLLRRVHEKQSAKRPEGLATEALLRFLVEKDYMLSTLGKLGCRDESGEPGADDNYVCFAAPLSFRDVS